MAGPSLRPPLVLRFMMFRDRDSKDASYQDEQNEEARRLRTLRALLISRRFLDRCFELPAAPEEVEEQLRPTLNVWFLRRNISIEGSEYAALTGRHFDRAEDVALLLALVRNVPRVSVWVQGVVQEEDEAVGIGEDLRRHQLVFAAIKDNPHIRKVHVDLDFVRQSLEKLAIDALGGKIAVVRTFLPQKYAPLLRKTTPLDCFSVNYCHDKPFGNQLPFRFILRSLRFALCLPLARSCAEDRRPRRVRRDAGRREAAQPNDRIERVEWKHTIKLDPKEEAMGVVASFPAALRALRTINLSFLLVVELHVNLEADRTTTPEFRRRARQLLDAGRALAEAAEENNARISELNCCLYVDVG